MEKAISKNILAMDVGDRRIGLAIASPIARLPRPLTTLYNTSELTKEMQEIINTENIGLIIVGLPRDMDSRETAQTKAVEAFVDKIRADINLPIVYHDEALTSKLAEAELDARKKPYTKEDIDALAATYILESYLTTKPELTV